MQLSDLRDKRLDVWLLLLQGGNGELLVVLDVGGEVMAGTDDGLEQMLIV